MTNDEIRQRLVEKGFLDPTTIKKDELVEMLKGKKVTIANVITRKKREGLKLRSYFNQGIYAGYQLGEKTFVAIKKNGSIDECDCPDCYLFLIESN